MHDLLKLAIVLGTPVLVFWLYRRHERKAQERLEKARDESLKDWVKDRN